MRDAQLYAEIYMLVHLTCFKKSPSGSNDLLCRCQLAELTM